MLGGENEADYFRRRAAAERAAAETAAGDKARTLHEQLATLYRARADTLGDTAASGVTR